MAPLQFVQPQRHRDRIEHLVGDVDGPTLFKPRVVVRAHTRQHRQLLAPQADHPPSIAGGRQPDVRGGEPRATRLQELRQLLLPGRHAAHYRAHPAGVDEPGSDRPRFNRT